MTDAVTYIAIDPEGVTVEHSSPITLEGLQAAVGGYVEAIAMSPSFCAWVNEDGLRERLPANPVASLAVGRPIVGTAVFTGGADSEGNTRPISPADAEHLRALR